MLSEFDLKRIREGVLGLPAFLELILHPADQPTPLGKRLSELAQSIEDGTGGAVLFRTAEAADLPARPGLTLSYQGRANLRYLALPEGPEAPPFVEAILDLPRGAAGCAEPLRALSALNRPAELLVFIASTCPHCPLAVRAANRISLTTPQVTTTIVDAQIFEDLARRYAVKSVPMTILDGDLTIGGVVPPAKLAEKIRSRAGDGFAAEVFLSLVESGRFDDAAGRIRDGFLPAWQKSATQLRMGLMLVAEKALENDPRALDDLVPGLIESTKSKDAALRGDTADLLGQIAHPSAVEPLKALLDDENPDVAEIAQEALGKIGED
jgi:glutaredoxin